MSNGAAMAPANDVSSMVEVPVYPPVAKGLEAEYARLREVAKSHWTGAKYDAERPFAETAKLIRKELAAAAKADGVLAGVKCSVKSGWSTYKRSLDITIVQVPTGDRMPIMNPTRVEFEMRNPHAHTMCSWLSARGKKIEAAVEAIARQCSYCKSDSMSDYSDVAFHISVTFSSEVRETHRAEVERAVRMAGRV